MRSDMTTALVTGGTDGIGKAIARGLAAQRMQVLIVGSNPRKGQIAERELRESTGNDHVYFRRADLSLMREVRRLADEVAAEIPVLHYLVLCAGVVWGRRVMTDEGIESNFAIGYLSRFALTQRLLPVLKNSRILVISGSANGKIHYPDVNLTTNFATPRVVRQLCEANDVFILEQARRLNGGGTINILKVGPVRTNISRG